MWNDALFWVVKNQAAELCTGRHLCHFKSIEMNFYHLTTDIHPYSSDGSASEDDALDPNWLTVKASSPMLSANKVNDDQVLVQRQIDKIFEAILPSEASNTTPSPSPAVVCPNKFGIWDHRRLDYKDYLRLSKTIDDYWRLSISKIIPICWDTLYLLGPHSST